MYNPRDWYWSVDGRLYSSRRNLYVGADDADYAAFVAAGNVATAIGSESELAPVLQAAIPDALPAWLFDPSGATTFVQPAESAYTADQLKRYANARQWEIAVGGCAVTIGGTPMPFATDPTSMALITGKALRLQQASPPDSVDWQFPTGFVTIAAADFIAAAVTIADYVQATFDKLKTVISSVDGGAMTTTAEVDAAFAAS